MCSTQIRRMAQKIGNSAPHQELLQSNLILEIMSKLMEQLWFTAPHMITCHPILNMPFLHFWPVLYQVIFSRTVSHSCNSQFETLPIQEMYSTWEKAQKSGDLTVVNSWRDLRIGRRVAHCSVHKEWFQLLVNTQFYNYLIKYKSLDLLVAVLVGSLSPSSSLQLF